MNINQYQAYQVVSVFIIRVKSSLYIENIKKPIVGKAVNERIKSTISSNGMSDGLASLKYFGFVTMLRTKFDQVTKVTITNATNTIVP